MSNTTRKSLALGKSRLIPLRTHPRINSRESSMAGYLLGSVRRSLCLAAVVVQCVIINSAAAEFRTGHVQVEQPLNSIKVTITVGEGGEELAEPVDVHLGVGFPLRLYPLGTDKREPAFAAIPQKTSLAADARSIK